MRITLVGSMKHAGKMVEIYHKLEKLGHSPVMHQEVFGIADGSAKELIKEISTDHASAKRKYDFIKVWHDLIIQGDAILVCNFDKNGIKNYIGGNTLMELGFAHVTNKKVFLYNEIPTAVPYIDEIKATVDVVLNGNLGLIPETNDQRKTKIFIGGSMSFATEMKNAKEELERAGFAVDVPLDTEHVIKDSSKKTDVAFLQELGVGRGDAELVSEADALLILNYEKHGTAGYIGPGAFRDLSVAWWLRKKIFFLFPYDENQNNQKYEMIGFAPVILNGDILRIKEYII